MNLHLEFIQAPLKKFMVGYESMNPHYNEFFWFMTARTEGQCKGRAVAVCIAYIHM